MYDLWAGPSFATALTIVKLRGRASAGGPPGARGGLPGPPGGAGGRPREGLPGPQPIMFYFLSGQRSATTLLGVQTALAGPQASLETCGWFLSRNYWKLQVYLRAKLECRVFGAVWPLIWWIWSGFSPPPPGRVRPIFGTIRHEFDVNLPCRGQIRHYFDIHVVNLRFQWFACNLC